MRTKIMPSARGFFLLVTVVTCFSVTDGWRWNFDWSTEEPANCPHENRDTHICSSLESINATCITIKCCDEFRDDEDASDYEDAPDESEEDNVYYIGKFWDSCRMCYSVKPCSTYKCYRRCCDGYEQDNMGRCQNKTGHLQCQNGGSLTSSFLGHYRCICPRGFTGKSCEIPICHCENGGECMVRDGKPFCNCSYGNSGARCEQSVCSMDCQNGGRCYRNGTHEFCRCTHNYVGKQCQQFFVQPDSCPIPEYRHPYCATYCTENEECGDGKVCCMEGCTTICRKPKAEYCKYGHRYFRIGQSFKPDACQNCTCSRAGKIQCSSMRCGVVRCPDGRKPESKTGECCQSCPDKPSDKPPVIYGCPTGVLHLNTTNYNNYVRLSERNTMIKSFDSSKRQLEVRFNPDYVRHCRCEDYMWKTTAVHAYAKDSNGNIASCTFKVVVRDIHPPVFTNCPEDIYVFDTEVVQWKEPSYYDNVGVAFKTCTDNNGKMFPIGNYQMTYQIWDYDKNTAFCRFHVSVTSEDTDIKDMPQGLRDRSKDKSNVALIVAPVVGLVFLIMVLVLLLFCCRRQCKSGASGQGRQTPAYDNNIYTTPGDINIKLPPYSDLPMNPPAYSITGTEKGGAYMSLAPPSYSNPGYETMKVHLKKSESLKSTKSEKADKESESTE